MRARELVLMLSVLGFSASHAQEAAPAEQQPPAPGVPWVFQQDGALKWGHFLSQGSVSNCGGAAILAAQERDPALEAQIANDISQFSCFAVLIRNDTPDRIQCQVRLEQPVAGQKKPLQIETGIVLDAEATRTALEEFSPNAQAPRAPATKCFAIPQTSPPFTRKKKCEGEFRAASPDRYYPPISRRNQEEGGVVIEYGVGKGSTKLRDVRVVTSSGFTALDTAALKVAYDSEATHKCTDARYRARIVFRLADVQ